MIHSFFIYLLPRKKTLDVLNWKLEGPGWSAHTQALGPPRIADHGCIDGRDGAHVRVGWDAHERRVNTFWEAIEVPSGPCAINGGRDVTGRARPRTTTRCRRTGGGAAADKQKDDEKSQYDNDCLHLYRL